jgi:hypothetical protein
VLVKTVKTSRVHSADVDGGYVDQYGGSEDVKCAALQALAHDMNTMKGYLDQALIHLNGLRQQDVALMKALDLLGSNATKNKQEIVNIINSIQVGTGHCASCRPGR